MIRYLKLFKYVQQINLDPAETLALIRRSETDSCRAEDDEVLIQIVEAHTALSADILQALPDLEPSSPAPQAKGQRQGAKRTRRRHRREAHRRLDMTGAVRYFLYPS